MRRLENSELHPKATRNRLLSLLIKGIPQCYTGRMLSRQEKRCHTDVSGQPSTALPCWERKTPFKGRFYQSCKKEQEQKDRDSSLFKRTTHSAHSPTCNYSIQMPLLWREGLSRLWRCKRQRDTVEKDRKLWSENLQASLGLPTCWALSLMERCVSHWHAKNKDPKPCLI